MSEALLKTMKRDFVLVSDRIETADQALAEVDGWFKDYNENHPHKGLKMKSPEEVTCWTGGKHLLCLQHPVSRSIMCHEFL